MDEVRTRTKPVSTEELVSWIGENREEMSTALFVVDASVAAKLVFQGEPNQENVVKLKNDLVLGLVELHAPAFIMEEVANALCRATKLKRPSQEDAKEALNALNDMKITLHELDWAQTAQSLGIARKHNIALCNASYLFLTNKVKAQLIIADNELFQTVKEHFGVLNINEYT